MEHNAVTVFGNCFVDSVFYKYGLPAKTVIRVYNGKYTVLCKHDDIYHV